MTLIVDLDSPPMHVPAGRGGIGAVSASATAYRWHPSPGDGSPEATLPLDGFTIRPGDVLEYEVLPEFHADAVDRAEGDPFASASACVDLLLADGRRISDLGAEDQHRVPLRPEDYRRGRTLVVDQWNRVTVDLSRFAGMEAAGALVTVRPAVHGFRGWIDGPRVGRVARRAGGSPVDQVCTLRGTNSSGDRSRGNAVPATAPPNAFHLTVPVTNADDPSWPYTFHRDVDDDGVPGLEAFALSHAATPWLGDHGVLHFFPLAPGVPSVDSPRDARRRFARGDEGAHPYRYSVRFADGGEAGVSGIDRATILEARSPFAGQVMLYSLPETGGRLEVTPDGQALVAFSDQQGPLPAGVPRCHFVAAWDSPARSVRSAVSPQGRPMVFVEHDLPAGQPLTVRVASSFVSSQQARRNLESSRVATAGLTDVAQQCRAEWAAILDNFEIDGASPDEAASFYGSLYRLFLYPNIGHEVDPAGRIIHRTVGRERAPDVISGPLSTNNGFWDTYRTAWPAYALFAPDRAAPLLDGFVQHYRDDGWLPRWSAPGAVDLMVGTSAGAVLADAMLKGVRLPDAESACDAAFKDAVVCPDHPWTGRKGAATSPYRGFVDDGVPEGMSWSLENAICDDALASLAAHRARTSDERARRGLDALAEYLASRASGYGRLFDGDSGFFRGRDRTGRFRGSRFDPLEWGGDYTETNAWGMAFTAPHDPLGLARLHGGARGLERKLDEFFATPEWASDAHVGGYGRIIHEMVEARDVRFGMWGLSNQPAHHIPFLYSLVGAPHKTQRITREALRRCFLGSDLGQGYPGDEDNGEMSAWYLFAALGFYPLAPGNEWYVLTSPLFPEARVTLADRRMLRVRAHDNGPENVYIQGLNVDGQAWNTPVIDHATLQRGADLEFFMGPHPSGWAASADLSALRKEIGPRVDAGGAGCDFPDGRLLLDDDATTEVSIPANGRVLWRHAVPRIARQYTVTASQDTTKCARDWTLEAYDGAEWRPIAAAADERFRWSRELRPFTPSEFPAALAHRLTFPSGGVLSEVELLIDEPARPGTSPEGRSAC